MLPTDSLTELQNSFNQCDALIANAHKTDANGVSIFSTLDRKQITVASFLNLFIAWEKFLENAVIGFMLGQPTVSGQHPVRYVMPISDDHAKNLIKGNNRYFEYGNQEYVKKLVLIYFDRGYPFEPHLSALSSDLADLRTIRNASAHITSSTQTALESLAQRIFTIPQPGIDVYDLLLKNDPQNTGKTVFVTYRDKLFTLAHLIAQG